ncbi:hypothetical protein M0R45_030898 [Rubus argutus]|uniref:Uncharacterized protein n=1 Tax=Rubus argutus TaxID=59490 RepID=A0AAW1WCC4_RUBAR
MAVQHHCCSRPCTAPSPSPVSQSIPARFAQACDLLCRYHQPASPCPLRCCSCSPQPPSPPVSPPPSTPSARRFLPSFSSHQSCRQPWSCSLLLCEVKKGN